jgi:tRNA(Ile)-lysidine synthase
LHKRKLLEYRGAEVHVPVLKLAGVEPLRTIVYEIVKPYGFAATQVDDIIRLLDSDSGKFVNSASHRVLRNRRWLIISPLNTTIAANIVINEGDDNIAFEAGVINIKTIRKVAQFDIPTSPLIACVDANLVTFPMLLRKWKQGDYFYPLGMKKKKKLSRFFIDQQLSLADKEKVWVLESDKKIIWVVGLRIDERFKIESTSSSILQFTLNVH